MLGNGRLWSAHWDCGNSSTYADKLRGRYLWALLVARTVCYQKRSGSKGELSAGQAGLSYLSGTYPQEVPSEVPRAALYHPRSVYNDQPWLRHWSAIAATQQWFYPSRYARVPLDVNEQTGLIDGVQKEATQSGIQVGDRLQALDGVPFTGDYQLLMDIRRSHPGEALEATVRHSDGAMQTVRIHLAPREDHPVTLYRETRTNGLSRHPRKSRAFSIG